MRVLSYFTRHRTAANLLLVLMLAAGALALPNMRAQFFPDVVVENVTLSVAWPGAGAEDVDAAVVQVLEPALMAVEGVTETSAVVREGSATITLEFEPGRDMAAAADDVLAAAEGVTGLPADAEAPEVRQSRWRDRVTDVVITGPVGVDQLARLADALTARLFAEGVTRASVRGIAAPEIEVEIGSPALLRNGVTLREVADAIRAAASADPAGDLTGANARIRTGADRRSADEIAAIVIRREADGTALTVGDLGTVSAGTVDRERAYFVGDDPAITLRVERSAEGDAIALQRTVEAVAEDLLRGVPEGVAIELIRTRTEAITGRIAILLDNAALGLMLVVALLFLFLNARTAFWVAAGIPAALMAAVALMWLGGLTINMISLFALIITLGIVVDDAIVVGEHADFRARTLGEPPVVAAERAAGRMALPVLSATITTVIAFFGLVAIGGRYGDLIAAIPFTVIAVLLASLVECFLILPHHMAGALRANAREAWYDWPSRVVNRGLAWGRDQLFVPLARLCIAARYPVAAGAIVLLSSQVALLMTGDVPWRFFNAPERGSITGNVIMSDEAGRAETLAQVREMQRAVDAVAAAYEAEHGMDPIDYALGQVGGTNGWVSARAADKEPDQLGALSIELIDADLRPTSSFAILGALQDEVRQLPKTEEISFRGWRSGPGGDGLEVSFSGADAATLKAAAEDLKVALARFPELSAIEDDLPYDRDELLLTLTPQGEALGFDAETLGRQLRDRLAGIEAATFPAGPRTGTIRVALPEAEQTADFLETMRLPMATGGSAALGDLVRVETRSGFASIRRKNGTAVVSVTGELNQDDPPRAAEIRQAIADDILPAIAADRRVAYAQGGLAEQERAFLTDATLGTVACLLGIFLVLAWIFSSWSRPLVIMAVIPFGLVGAIWGHWWWDVPLSMFSVVGLIGMVGIIINDSIVLVTTVDEYARDRAQIPAIVDAVRDRLRPVLLTTLTTVLGLTPLLYETSSQAQWLRPTVITLVYGLGFGMVLVLILVPALLAMGHDLSRAGVALRRALRLPLRRRGRMAGLAVAAAGAAILVWAGATLLPPLLDRTGRADMAGAVGLFLGGTAALVAGLWALAVLRTLWGSRRAQTSPR